MAASRKDTSAQPSSSGKVAHSPAAAGVTIKLNDVDLKTRQNGAHGDITPPRSGARLHDRNYSFVEGMQGFGADNSETEQVFDGDNVEVTAKNTDSTQQAVIGNNQQENMESAQQPTQAEKSKKNGPRKNTGRGPTALNKFRGSGFEENYADPPMTLEEYNEEKALYSPDNPFLSRIEECIHRFRSRRRLDNLRSRVFSNYLNLGGIDTSQRQFTGTTGIPKEALAEMTAAEKREAAANDIIQRRNVSIRYYTAGDEGWEVDFTGVVSGYLSRVLPQDVAGDPVLIQTGIDTIMNWLNYVVRHDVCPEYADDLDAARRLCKIAKIEFRAINTIKSAGIGQFNYACRKIFNLDKEQDDDGWVDPIAYDPTAQRGLSPARIFVSTLTFLKDLDCDERHYKNPARYIDPAKYYDAASKSFGSMAVDVTDVKIKLETIKIVGKVEPDEGISRLYAGLLDSRRATGSYHDAGLVSVEPCIIEDGYADTPKLHEMEDTDTVEKERDTYITDGKILRRMREGMMFRVETATVTHPDFKLKFITKVLEVQPSFYRFLPQELMIDFKEPRFCDRDGEEVDNPDAEMDLGPGLEGCTDDLDDL